MALGRSPSNVSLYPARHLLHPRPRHPVPRPSPPSSLVCGQGVLYYHCCCCVATQLHHQNHHHDYHQDHGCDLSDVNSVVAFRPETAASPTDYVNAGAAAAEAPSLHPQHFLYTCKSRQRYNRHGAPQPQRRQRLPQRLYSHQNS